MLLPSHPSAITLTWLPETPLVTPINPKIPPGSDNRYCGRSSPRKYPQGRTQSKEQLDSSSEEHAHLETHPHGLEDLANSSN